LRSVMWSVSWLAFLGGNGVNPIHLLLLNA
jgi:hypothetical protein